MKSKNIHLTNKPSFTTIQPLNPPAPPQPPSNTIPPFLISNPIQP